jgi:multidrug transporter EmrE-like cation transporter
LFGDKVTAVRVIGLVLICLGVVLVALSKPPGTA